MKDENKNEDEGRKQKRRMKDENKNEDEKCEGAN